MGDYGGTVGPGIAGPDVPKRENYNGGEFYRGKLLGESSQENGKEVK